MEYYIYLDVFFLRIFVMNLLCLKSAGDILYRKCRWKRLVISAATGAVWNIVVLLWGISIPGMSILTAGVMCFIAYDSGRKGWRGKELVLLLFIAFSMEGAVSWFHAEIAVLFVPIICSFIGRERKRQDKELKVVLSFKGRKKELRGFYDSGNCLLEPLTGKIVHIACYDQVKELLPKPYRQVVEQYFETDFFESTKVTELQMYEFTFLSYHSIGKENGQLLGIRMDSAEFESAAGKKTEEKVVIGLTEQRLFVRGQDRVIVNGRLEL